MIKKINRHIKNISGLKHKLKEKCGKDNQVMFLSGMGGTGKSEVIKAFFYFAANISNLFGWVYNNDKIKITGMPGAAACEIQNGRTLHKMACIYVDNIRQNHKDMWKSTKMLIIDEVSFLNTTTIVKLDKQMFLLKEIEALYGNVHIVLVSDFFQMLPMKGKSLFQNDTVQFGAINKAVFLNILHRFKNDKSFGKIMRRFRHGTITKEDIHCTNSRHVNNHNIQLPSITELRCACYMNDERNAFDNVVFLKHLQATHLKYNDTCTEYPTHTCIIKATMQYKKKCLENISSTMHNRILDECGDSDITNLKKRFVDPAFKLFYNVPLMMNTNERIEEESANGISYRGLYIKLKPGCMFQKENWEG